MEPMQDQEIRSNFLKLFKKQYDEWVGKGGCKTMIAESVTCGADKEIYKHACEEAQEKLGQDQQEQKESTESIDEMKQLTEQVHKLTDGIPGILYTCMNLMKILQELGLTDLTEMKAVMDVIKPSLVR